MDIKKQIEEMAREAGVAAKGQAMLCHCATCEDAITEAEATVEDLCKNFCGQFAWYVAAIMLYRLRSLYGVNDALAAAIHEMDIVTRTQDMGLPPVEFARKIAEWEAEVRPAKDGS